MLTLAVFNTESAIHEYYQDRKRLPVKCRNPYCGHERKLSLEEQMNSPECPACGK